MQQVDWFNLADPLNTVRLVGFLIPLVTGLLTKVNASSAVKALMTLALSALTSAVGVLVAADGTYAWTAFVNAFVNTFVPAVVAYYGLWKPVGLAARVQNATPRVGIGGGRRSGGTRGTHGALRMSEGGYTRNPVFLLGVALLVLGVVLFFVDLAAMAAVATWIWAGLVVVGLIVAIVGATRHP